MVVIRLARGGAKKSPFYTIVVTDKKARRDSNWIERIGYFNPIATGNSQPFQIDKERLAYWISQGAQPSDRVVSLLKNHEKSVA